MNKKRKQKAKMFQTEQTHTEQSVYTLMTEKKNTEKRMIPNPSPLKPVSIRRSITLTKMRLQT
jgi:hypothetical protein